jgi:CYTH domain-containing protein
MLEIERKFLVLSTVFLKEAYNENRIVQAYLNSNPERAVRIRIKDSKGYLTIKGKGNASGTTRLEWETEIPLKDAENLLLICEEGRIDKTRYEVQVGRHLFEVDVFKGKNEGLVIAEIELGTEEEEFEKPHWLGMEVTSDERFYNAYLSKHPYQSW